MTDLSPQLVAKSSDASGSKHTSATATSENGPLEKGKQRTLAHHGGGLAPASALDKLGFEPAQFPVAPLVHYSTHWLDESSLNLWLDAKSSDPPQLELATSVKTTDKKAGTQCSSHAATPLVELLLGKDHDDLDWMFNDNTFIVGRPSEAVLDIVEEGLDQIAASLTDLAAHSGQPPQQLMDRFIRQYAHLNSANNWNKYGKFYVQNMEAELEHPRKSGEDSIMIGSPGCKHTMTTMYCSILTMFQRSPCTNGAMSYSRRTTQLGRRFFWSSRKAHNMLKFGRPLPNGNNCSINLQQNWHNQWISMQKCGRHT